jgi:hypothetical protein
MDGIKDTVGISGNMHCRFAVPLCRPHVSRRMRSHFAASRRHGPTQAQRERPTRSEGPEPPRPRVRPVEDKGISGNSPLSVMAADSDPHRPSSSLSVGRRAQRQRRHHVGDAIPSPPSRGATRPWRSGVSGPAAAGPRGGPERERGRWAVARRRVAATHGTGGWRKPFLVRVSVSGSRARCRPRGRGPHVSRPQWLPPAHALETPAAQPQRIRRGGGGGDAGMLLRAARCAPPLLLRGGDDGMVRRYPLAAAPHAPPSPNPPLFIGQVPFVPTLCRRVNDYDSARKIYRR